MKAPPGAVVSLYVDLVARVTVGDLIETQSGRRYRVLGVREQQRGKHRGRQHLQCIVLGPHDELVSPPSTEANHLHRIRWYARGRKARR